MVSESIDLYCHSKEDNYMIMMILANITRYSINKGYITYEELYLYDEEYLLNKLKNIDDIVLQELIYFFETIDIKEIPDISLSGVKIRDLNPLVLGKRYK